MTDNSTEIHKCELVAPEVPFVVNGTPSCARRMERPGTASSQLSECSGVLDLSCTYNLSQGLQPEPSDGTLEEEFSCSLTLGSPSSSLNSGFRTCSFEDNEKIKPEDNESFSSLSPSSSSSIVGDQRSCTTLQTDEDMDEAQIRANLDAFYELSSQPGDDVFSHKLTEKILELKQKKHLYALHSFQVAKIILQQEGAKVLQDSVADNAFSSTGETNIKPVPGISDDVVRFLKESTKEGS